MSCLCHAAEHLPRAENLRLSTLRESLAEQSGRKVGLWGQNAQVQISSVLLSWRMSLEQAVDLIVPRFPHLTSGSNNAAFFIRYQRRLGGIIRRAEPKML